MGPVRYVAILFADAMIKGKPIHVFNYGNMSRDLTSIDDNVIRVLYKPATPDANFDALCPDPTTSAAPYRVFNISNGNPTLLMGLYRGA